MFFFFPVGLSKPAVDCLHFAIGFFDFEVVSLNCAVDFGVVSSDFAPDFEVVSPDSAVDFGVVSSDCAIDFEVASPDSAVDCGVVSIDYIVDFGDSAIDDERMSCGQSNEACMPSKSRQFRRNTNLL